MPAYRFLGVFIAFFFILNINTPLRALDLRLPHQEDMCHTDADSYFRVHGVWITSVRRDCCTSLLLLLLLQLPVPAGQLHYPTLQHIVLISLHLHRVLPHMSMLLQVLLVKGCEGRGYGPHFLLGRNG